MRPLMDAVPRDFARTMVELYGAEGVAWLDRLPSLIADCAQRWSLKVKPPFDDVKRGVFATRSSRRPNRIGLSLVRLLRREGNVLFVESEDILDGTPVLDIKPFIPGYDTADEARSGWLEHIPNSDRQASGCRRKKEASD